MQRASPPIAIVKPARNHDDAIVVAVAARSHGRADEFARKWDIPKAYGGDSAYQGLGFFQLSLPAVEFLI